MPLDDKSDTSSASWGACYDAHSLLLLSHLSTSAISWSLNFNCSKDRSTHRSPAIGFVASRNKQVSSAKFSQYPIREPCLNCFDVSASFYHEENE